MFIVTIYYIVKILFIAEYSLSIKFKNHSFSDIYIYTNILFRIDEITPEVRSSSLGKFIWTIWGPRWHSG